MGGAKYLDRVWKNPSEYKIEKLIIVNYPYFHVDVFLENGDIFGVPLNYVKGMAFYVLPPNKGKKINKKELLKQAPTKFCKYHNEKMIPTKLFVFERIRLQYKCPVCFLTDYFDY